MTYPGGTTESYTYDAAGNRLTKKTGGATATCTYDDPDQLLNEGPTTHTHDAAGNMTARGSDSFTWDWAIQRLARESERVSVLLNNCREDRAVVNARQIAAMLHQAGSRD